MERMVNPRWWPRSISRERRCRGYSRYSEQQASGVTLLCWPRIRVSKRALGGRTPPLSRPLARGEHGWSERRTACSTAARGPLRKELELALEHDASRSRYGSSTRRSG
eukprot:5690590-Lingulodinium_polyedra.AAC.1